MKNLVLAIVVASFAILGFFAYQSSQKVMSLQSGLEATEAALVTMEGEKAALEKQVADLEAAANKAAVDVEAKLAEAEAAATVKLLEKVNALEAEKAAMSASNDAKTKTLTDTVAALEAEKTALVQEAAALQAKVDELTAAAATATPSP